MERKEKIKAGRSRKGKVLGFVGEI